MNTANLSTFVTVLALFASAFNAFMGWNRRRYISIREQEMKGAAMERLAYLLFVEPTRWGELLLGIVKCMLGLNLIGYLIDPPKSTATIPVQTAAMIGAAILLLGLSQLVTVMLEWKWPRFVICCLATFMWIYFMGSQWIATESLRTILIYIPLLMFNFIVAMRIARIKRKIDFEVD